jgi:hypothetical protein
MHNEGRKGEYEEERTTMTNVEMKIGKDLKIVGNKSKMKMKKHKKVMVKGKVQMITMGYWILQMMLHIIRNSSSL